MRISTRDGEVELTADMVCRGMVFEDEEGINRMTVGDGSHGEQGQREAAAMLEGLVFLGCDPVVATRADCERFGVHGDAGAHGFARLRDGGAVDLRVTGNGLSRGSVVQREGETEPRVVLSAGKPALWRSERFLGLDSRHASPEDVERLCCGAHQRDVHEGRPRDAMCTLAIGDHDQHEDLATGELWAAEKGGYWHMHLPNRPRLRIGALMFPCEIGLDGRDRYRVRFEAKIDGDFDGPAAVAARSLAAGEPCVLEMGDQKIPCLAAQWSHEADPMRRGVERFELTLWRQHQEAPADAAVLSDFAADAIGVPREAQTVTTYEPKDGGRVTHVREWPDGAGNPLFAGSGPSIADYVAWLTGTEGGNMPNATIPPPEAPHHDVVQSVALASWGTSAARAFCEFLAGLQAWAASPAGQLAARDAAVAKACGEVPEGCEPGRWRTVVHVIAADAWEEALVMTGCYGTLEGENFAHCFRAVERARGVCALYAAARKDGWPREVAREKASAALPEWGERVERWTYAYEAA